MTSIALLVAFAFATTLFLPEKEYEAVCLIMNASETETSYAYSQCNETYCAGN